MTEAAATAQPGVTVAVKPSEQAVQTRTSEVTITDSVGRLIKLKRPGVLATYRLVDVLGDSAKNETYMAMVLPLIYVESIDGDRVHTSTRAQIEALIQRLDEEGIAAVMAGVKDHFGEIAAKATGE